jgi:hypothetical protein
MDLQWSNTETAELKYLDTCPIVTLTITNLTRLDQGSYLDLRGATCRLTATTQ